MEAEIKSDAVTHSDSTEDLNKSRSDHGSMSDDAVPGKTTQEKVEEAQALKEKAKLRIQDKDYKEALSLYETAVKLFYEDTLEGVGDDVDTDASLSELKVSLQSNVALCHLKLDNWIGVIQSCNEVLKLDKSNLKALYRRGMARSNLGMLEEAKTDLLSAHRQEPGNPDIREEIKKLQSRVDAAKALEKERLSGLFQKTQGLYRDQDMLVAKKKKVLSDQMAKDQIDFQKANEERIKQSLEPFETIDAWKASIAESEPSAPAQASMPSPPSLVPKKPGSAAVDDSPDLDEEDEKILKEVKKMGYRYFDRKGEAKQFETELQKPKPIEVEPAPVPQPTSTSQKHSLSSWNAGGTTYEERDYSQWLADNFRKKLNAISFEGDRYALHVSGLDKLECDGYLVIIQGKKRFPYTCHVELRWEWSSAVSDLRLEGLLVSDDISPSAYTSNTDGEYQWKSEPEIRISTTTKKHAEEADFETGMKWLKQELLSKLREMESEIAELIQCNPWI